MIHSKNERRKQVSSLKLKEDPETERKAAKEVCTNKVIQWSTGQKGRLPKKSTDTNALLKCAQIKSLSMEYCA